MANVFYITDKLSFSFEDCQNCKQQCVLCQENDRIIDEYKKI